MAETVNTPSPRAWLSELRSIQQWIEDHPVLLGSAAILLPSISVYHYTMSERVPLTIASPDIIAALPSVLAAIAFLTVALCALPLLPISLMFEGAMRDDEGRLRLLPREAKQRGRDLFRWMSAFAAPGLIIATGVFVSVKWLPEAKWPMPVTLALASTAFTLIVNWIKGVQGAKLASESTLLALGMSTLQMLLAILVMQGALRLLGPSPSDKSVAIALLLSAPVLAFVQMLAVTVIELTSQRTGFVTQAFVAALSLIALACIVPTTGAVLAGSVIRGSASGNERCVQLRLAADAQDFADLLPAPVSSRNTFPMYLLSNTDGTYLARRAEASIKTIYRIPTDQVIAVTPSACPSQHGEP